MRPLVQAANPVPLPARENAGQITRHEENENENIHGNHHRNSPRSSHEVRTNKKGSKLIVGSVAPNRPQCSIQCGDQGHRMWGSHLNDTRLMRARTLLSVPTPILLALTNHRTCPAHSVKHLLSLFCRVRTRTRYSHLSCRVLIDAWSRHAATRALRHRTVLVSEGGRYWHKTLAIISSR